MSAGEEKARESAKTRVTSRYADNSFWPIYSPGAALSPGTGESEEAAAGVGRELFQHVDLRELREYFHETFARIALVADEEQPRVILHGLALGRPAFRSVANTIIIRIGASENSRAVIAFGSGEPHMGVERHDRIAVLVHRIEIEIFELVALSERRTRVTMAADRLFLETDAHPVPMLECDQNAPGHHIAAAMHPCRRIISGENISCDCGFVLGFQIAGTVLETHEIARRFAGTGIRQEARLRPADSPNAPGELRETAHRMKSNLRIVRAGLHGNVAARARFNQLIAGEFGYVDQCVRAAAAAKASSDPCRPL